jgi:hypothetical protein
VPQNCTCSYPSWTIEGQGPCRRWQAAQQKGQEPELTELTDGLWHPWMVMAVFGALLCLFQRLKVFDTLGKGKGKGNGKCKCKCKCKGRGKGKVGWRSLTLLSWSMNSMTLLSRPIFLSWSSLGPRRYSCLLVHTCSCVIAFMYCTSSLSLYPSFWWPVFKTPPSWTETCHR